MRNFKQKEVETTTRHGHKTRLVDDYMTRDLVTFRPDTPLRDVVSALLDKRITGAPVLDERDRVVGLIDDKDCLRLAFDSLYHNLPVHHKTTQEYMSNVMKSVKTGTDIMEAANIFLTTPYKRLLVLDDQGSLQGQISRRDVLRAVREIEWGQKD